MVVRKSDGEVKNKKMTKVNKVSADEFTALTHGFLNSSEHTRIQCKPTQRWCTLRQTVRSDAKRCTSATGKLKK